MPRLSKRFIKSLEDLACDTKLEPDIRKEVAELLVRLYTATPRPATVNRRPKTKAEAIESLEKLVEEL